MGRNSEWKVYMWQALAQICVCIGVCHWDTIARYLAGLATGSSLVREAKIKSNGCFFFFVFFFPNFTAVTTNRKRKTVW